MRFVPFFLPSQATPSLESSAWLSSACLRQLCAVQSRRRDADTCQDDASWADASYPALNASGAVKAGLQTSFGAREYYSLIA